MKIYLNTFSQTWENLFFLEYRAVKINKHVKMEKLW